MGEKRILIILGIMNVIVLGVLGGLYIKKDSVPPVITIDKDGFVYEEGMNPEELLTGVSAADPEDGDVSGTLVVEKVVPNAEKRMALITYGAMDSKGNMSKASCKAEMLVGEAEHPSEMLPVAGEAGDMEVAVAPMEAEATPEETAPEEETEETEAEAPTEVGAENREETAGQEENLPEETRESARNEEAARTEPQAEAQQAENPPVENPPAPPAPPVVNEAPSLRFGKTEVTTVKGQDPAWVNFIGELTDNKDNYEYLLNHLKIDGKYDRTKEGTYSVKVSTVDSDGNESKATSVTIEVK